MNSIEDKLNNAISPREDNHHKTTRPVLLTNAS
jgi:hypothetical protein